MQALIALTVAVFLASPPEAHPPTLARGIEAFRQGDYEAALLSLDTAVRELSGTPDSNSHLASAYLHLGATYAHLRQPTLARSKFVEALRADPRIAPGADEFAPAVHRIFLEARQSFSTTQAAEKGAHRKSGKGGMILLGMGGAAAAGVAVVVTTKGSAANTAPTASVSVAPAGQVITAVTTVTLTATANDPDGTALTYSWALSDGAVQTGPTVTHVFSSDGPHTVTLTVSDGVDTATATTTVTSRSLTGAWLSNPGLLGETEFAFTQAATTLRGEVNFGRPTAVFGTLASPRRVAFAYTYQTFDGGGIRSCQITAAGEVDASLDAIAGTWSCSCGSGGSNPPGQDCTNQPARAFTMRRR
jgi:hypothetical protein